MPCCEVKGCKNYSSKRLKGSGITYHRFPAHHARHDVWLRLMRLQRGDAFFKPSEHARICSAHFQDDDFKITPTGLRTLKRTAIPRVQIHEPSEPPTYTAVASRQSRMQKCSSKSQTLDSDDEPADTDGHYTSGGESQNGRLRLSGGAGNAGSLLPETPAHSLQQELLMDLHEISDKIQNFYPVSLGKQFTLTFNGEDGDKTEYVFTSASETRRSGERHADLSCNECGSDIVGFRYKCVSCADYDLCSACEALGTHADHLMMRIAKPIKLKQARSLLQRWCEAMKTAGVTTIEEITGSPDSAESDSEPADTVSDDIVTSVSGVAEYTSLVLEVGPINTRPKVVKGKTLKDKVRRLNNTTQLEKIAEAKKRKVDASEGKGSVQVEITIKEEPSEDTDFGDYCSSFDETESTAQVEHVKVEFPDPLDTGRVVKTEAMEDDTSSTPSSSS